MEVAQSGRGSAKIYAVILNLFAGLQYAIAASYTVGGDAGWGLGNNYASWAKTNTFAVGDSLVFNYGPSHSVLQVSQADYAACNINKALKTYRSGKDTVTLTDPASYFICGTPGHCQSGMQVAILTSSSPSTPTPPTPTNPTPTSGHTPTVNTPPSSPGSSSATRLLQSGPTQLLLLSPFAVAVVAFLL